MTLSPLLAATGKSHPFLIKLMEGMCTEPKGGGAKSLNLVPPSDYWRNDFSERNRDLTPAQSVIGFMVLLRHELQVQAAESRVALNSEASRSGTGVVFTRWVFQLWVIGLGGA